LTSDGAGKLGDRSRPGLEFPPEWGERALVGKSGSKGVAVDRPQFGQGEPDVLEGSEIFVGEGQA